VRKRNPPSLSEAQRPKPMKAEIEGHILSPIFRVRVTARRVGLQISISESMMGAFLLSHTRPTNSILWPSVRSRPVFARSTA